MEASGSGFQAAPVTERFLCEKLLDQSQPIAERYRALFSLRNLSGPTVRDALIQAMRGSSDLLAHESAFALGQMQDVEAVPALERILQDLSLHSIVRQAAAESLGVIGLERSVPILKRSLDSDPAEEVRGTCELALRRMEEKASRGQVSGAPSGVPSPFLSVDPALPATDVSSTAQLRKVLLDENESLYKRCAALFALRDHGGKEAVNAIIASLGAASPLLRHEVAYVLGQLQDKAASAALSAILKDINEHSMVRHEAAEALGSIADQSSAALLKEFTRDVEPIVSQSCEVALSMLEFERCGKSFEFLYMQTPQVM